MLVILNFPLSSQRAPSRAFPEVASARVTVAKLMGCWVAASRTEPFMRALPLGASEPSGVELAPGVAGVCAIATIEAPNVKVRNGIISKLFFIVETDSKNIPPR
jgi:hypothetical protein